MRPSEETGLNSKFRDRRNDNGPRALMLVYKFSRRSPTALDERSEILLLDVRWTAFIYPLAVPTKQRAERSQASYI